jgi:hypothetical protein
MCSLRFENNLLTIEGVRFASISKKTPLSKLSLAFVSLALPLLIMGLSHPYFFKSPVSICILLRQLVCYCSQWMTKLPILEVCFPTGCTNHWLMTCVKRVWSTDWDQVWCAANLNLGFLLYFFSIKLECHYIRWKGVRTIIQLLFMTKSITFRSLSYLS